MSDEIAKILPPAARSALAAAAKLDPSTPRNESQERTNALHRVIREIKEHYPQFFSEGSK